jgi:hypothetical protein
MSAALVPGALVPGARLERVADAQRGAAPQWAAVEPAAPQVWERAVEGAQPAPAALPVPGRPRSTTSCGPAWQVPWLSGRAFREQAMQARGAGPLAPRMEAEQTEFPKRAGRAFRAESSSGWAWANRAWKWC